MSNLFGAHLKTILESRGMLGKEAAQAAGLDPSVVSRIISRQQKHVPADTLVHLVTAVGRNDRECAELVASHLRDECPAMWAPLVEVRVVGQKEQRRLPASAESDLEALRARMERDPSVHALVRQLVKVLEGE